MVNESSKMLVWAYHQRVSRLKNVAEKLKIRYGKNKTISVGVKGRLDPISKKARSVFVYIGVKNR
jgi:hypothetical protein